MSTCEHCGNDVSNQTQHTRRHHPDVLSEGCPGCEGQFETEAGVKRHHAQVHGDSLAKEESKCEVCGEAFEYYPSTRHGRFCSGVCEQEFLQTCKSSEHMAWQGYGSRTLRLAIVSGLDDESWQGIRERHVGDGCEMCGATEVLALHHIVPVFAGGLNQEWNFMTLCPSCHRTAEATSNSIAPKPLNPETLK